MTAFDVYWFLAATMVDVPDQTPTSTCSARFDAVDSADEWGWLAALKSVSRRTE